MEGIPSESILGNVTATQGPAPKHTAGGHERCAYYHASDSFEHDTIPGMSCPHGEGATGAVYSEDYVRELRIAAQEIIALWDSGAGYAFSRTMRAAVAHLRELVE